MSGEGVHAVATGPAGEVTIQLDDSSKVNLGTSTEIVWSKTQPCLGSFSGFPQIVRGVLTWTASGERLRGFDRGGQLLQKVYLRLPMWLRP